MKKDNVIRNNVSQAKNKINKIKSQETNQIWLCKTRNEWASKEVEHNSFQRRCIPLADNNTFSWWRVSTDKTTILGFDTN